MYDVMTRGAERDQVPYGVYLISLADGRQWSDVMDMDKIGANCPILVFVVKAARLAGRPVVRDAALSCRSVALIYRQFDRRRGPFGER